MIELTPIQFVVLVRFLFQRVHSQKPSFVYAVC